MPISSLPSYLSPPPAFPLQNLRLRWLRCSCPPGQAAFAILLGSLTTLSPVAPRPQYPGSFVSFSSDLSQPVALPRCFSSMSSQEQELQNTNLCPQGYFLPQVKHLLLVGVYLAPCELIVSPRALRQGLHSFICSPVMATFLPCSCGRVVLWQGSLRGGRKSHPELGLLGPSCP